MINDPYYIKIDESLSKKVDEDAFEQCAWSLLKKLYPRLVPISGGSDHGRDGIVFDENGESIVLVSTTSKNFIENLKKNLNSYVQTGQSARRVIFATTQLITTSMEDKLRNCAKVFGFLLCGKFDKAWFAQELYTNPMWCKSLLNISGKVNALSPFPLSSRPIPNNVLVGRQNELKFIKDTKGDLMIIGVPGSGKTFLLRSLAQQESALFVIDKNNSEGIANEVREKQPQYVIYDDAFIDIEFIVELKHIRCEINSDFRIIATTWPSDFDNVSYVLGVPSHMRIALGQLSRDLICTIIEGIGVNIPSNLVSFIADISQGLPGRAATLSYLCLEGDVDNVVSGQSLLEELKYTLNKRIVQNEAFEVIIILACFSLGGNLGISEDIVREYLELPYHRLKQIVSNLSIPSLIENPYNDRISIWPPQLRYILTKQVFYEMKNHLDINKIYNMIDNKKDMAIVISGAYGLGAKVPNIIPILEDADCTEAWKFYVLRGKSEAEYIFKNHPEVRDKLLSYMFLYIPEMTVDRCLELALLDIDNANNHSLKTLKEWVLSARNTYDAINRRKIILSRACAWIDNGKNKLIALKAFMFSIKPDFEFIEDAPNMKSINIYFGVLPIQELYKIKEIWKDIKQRLSLLAELPLLDIFDVVHSWLHPRYTSKGHATKEQKKIMLEFAFEILKDISGLTHHRPAIQQHIYEIIKNYKVNITLNRDTDFEILYPIYNYDNIKDAEKKWFKQAKALGNKWYKMNPYFIAEKINIYENDARSIKKNWPIYTAIVFQTISEKTDDIMLWLTTLIDAGAGYRAIHPFLWKSVEMKLKNWEECMKICINDTKLCYIARDVLLQINDTPIELLLMSLKSAYDYSQQIEYLCSKKKISNEKLKLILKHENENKNVVSAAAIGMWENKQDGYIDDDIYDEWLEAILNTSEDEYFLYKICEKDNEIAYMWLERWFRREESSLLYPPGQIYKIAHLLKSEHRVKLITNITIDIVNPCIVKCIIDSDLTAFIELLNIDRFKTYHLAPLGGHPTIESMEMAKYAYSRGYAKDEIAKATFINHQVIVYSAPRYRHLIEWANEFNQYINSNDQLMSEIAEICKNYGLYLAEREQEISSDFIE